jgi:hypothetical protein
VSPNGGNINLATSNSSATLSGSSTSSNYKGLLIFVDHSQTGTPTFSFGGGGALSLTGTIYATSSSNVSSTRYQSVTLQGNSGSATLLKGEIITDVLALGGGGAITMQLDPNLQLPVNQIALVK